MFTQYQLPYDYRDLEPHIDELTMLTHYTKHHGAYTGNLNSALEKSTEVSQLSIEEILSNLANIHDPSIRTTIRNNGGGYYNHNLYFSLLSPKPGRLSNGALEKRIVKDFGSLDALKTQLTSAAMGRFGSGWAWLTANKDGSLNVSSTANQDNPLMDDSSVLPILGIDVWEHAYYLKYKNLRADYLKAFWNVVDWKVVETLYNQL